jgi:hypothetical protein
MHHRHNTHHTGKSLKPVKKFKFGHSRIPMKGPRRGHTVKGRRGGLRG